MSTIGKSTIFGLMPFEPRRTLILPCKGGEITLYALDGQVMLTKSDITSPYQVGGIWFGGWDHWSAPYASASLIFERDDPADSRLRGIPCLNVEVLFRLIPDERSGQTAEVVAISVDGGETFFDNELCTLPAEYTALLV